MFLNVGPTYQRCCSTWRLGALHGSVLPRVGIKDLPDSRRCSKPSTPTLSPKPPSLSCRRTIDSTSAGTQPSSTAPQAQARACPPVIWSCERWPEPVTVELPSTSSTVVVAPSSPPSTKLTSPPLPSSPYDEGVRPHRHLHARALPHQSSCRHLTLWSPQGSINKSLPERRRRVKP
jgi:hypothetical protein